MITEEIQFRSAVSPPTAGYRKQIHTVHLGDSAKKKCLCLNSGILRRWIRASHRREKEARHPLMFLKLFTTLFTLFPDGMEKADAPVTFSYGDVGWKLY